MKSSEFGSCTVRDVLTRQCLYGGQEDMYRFLPELPNLNKLSIFR